MTTDHSSQLCHTQSKQRERVPRRCVSGFEREWEEAGRTVGSRSCPLLFILLTPPRKFLLASCTHGTSSRVSEVNRSGRCERSAGTRAWGSARAAGAATAGATAGCSAATGRWGMAGNAGHGHSQRLPATAASFELHRRGTRLLRAAQACRKSVK